MLEILISLFFKKQYKNTILQQKVSTDDICKTIEFIICCRAARVDPLALALGSQMVVVMVLVPVFFRGGPLNAEAEIENEGSDQVPAGLPGADRSPPRPDPKPWSAWIRTGGEGFDGVLSDLRGPHRSPGCCIPPRRLTSCGPQAACGRAPGPNEFARPRTCSAPGA